MDSKAGLVGQVVNLLGSHATWTGFIIAGSLHLQENLLKNY